MHTSYITLLINCEEYLRKIDIACLDIEKAAHQKSRSHKGFVMHLYDIPVFAGIEIKYRKLGDQFGLDSCQRNLKKLQDLNVPHPVVLDFIQSEFDVEAFFSNLPKASNAPKLVSMHLSDKNLMPTGSGRVKLSRKLIYNHLEKLKLGQIQTDYLTIWAGLEFSYTEYQLVYDAFSASECRVLLHPAIKGSVDVQWLEFEVLP